MIIKLLGRGVSETTVANAEDGDAALLAKIRVGDGPEVDPYEASQIIERLSQADVDDVSSEGGGFRVVLRVPGGTTGHVLRMPNAKDVIEYRRGFARILDLPYNRQELTVNLAAAGSLYQKVSRGTEGYAGAVAIIHQGVARPTLPAVLGSLELAPSGALQSATLPGRPGRRWSVRPLPTRPARRGAIAGDRSPDAARARPSGGHQDGPAGRIGRCCG